MLSVFHILFLLFFAHGSYFFRNSSLCHGKHGETFALLGTFINGFNYFIYIIWNLRNQNDVCTTCNTSIQTKLSNLVPHNFNNKHTVMGRCRGVNTVNRICSNIHRTVKSKGHIRSIYIVVNGLRKMNDIQSFLTKQVCCFLCTVATENHQTVQTQLVVILLHGLYLVQSVLIRYTHQLKWLSG